MASAFWDTLHSWKKTLQLVSPRRRSRWSAAHSSPYETGRPPGALSGNRRRIYPHDWELRELARHDERFETLDTDEDDEQGVILNSTGFALRDARQRGYAGDPMYFERDVYGPNRTSRRGYYGPYEEYNSEEEDILEQRGAEFQASVREKEEALIASALERIARARAKGKMDVSLTPEEMDALERRRNQQLEPLPTPTSPPTPSSKKGKIETRTSSASSLSSQKTRKRTNTGLFGNSPAKSNSKAKVSRRVPTDPTPMHSPPPQPAGIMVPGPDGVPVYASIAYYPQPSTELVRPPVGKRSRSSSKHSRRESTPPEQAYAQLPQRYYPSPAGIRPDSSSSNRSLPDDIDWHPPPPRSNTHPQYAPYRPLDDYDATPPSMPAAQGWRGIGGSPEVRYSTLRRVPPASSPLASRTSGITSNPSDPASSRKKESGLARVRSSSSSTSSSSSSSDDQGVQVEVQAGPAGGYLIKNTPSPTTARGNPGGKRKDKRK